MRMEKLKCGRADAVSGRPLQQTHIPAEKHCLKVKYGCGRETMSCCCPQTQTPNHHGKVG